MKLELLPQAFTIYLLQEIPTEHMNKDFFFYAKTDEEISLLCPSDFIPNGYIEKNDGWKGLRIQGALDFSLVGILSPIASLLAEESISIFAVSTYRTDYIFIKKSQLSTALLALQQKGYDVEYKTL